MNRPARRCSENVRAIGPVQTEMHVRRSTEIAQVVCERIWRLAFKHLSGLPSLQRNHRLGKFIKTVLLRNRPDGKYREHNGAVYDEHRAPKPKEDFPEEFRHKYKPAMD